MEKQETYALKKKGSFSFLCVSETLTKHEDKVQQAYWGWRRIKPRETSASIDDFLAEFDRVKITIEPTK